jgi:hypothetical protein
MIRFFSLFVTDPLRPGTAITLFVVAGSAPGSVPHCIRHRALPDVSLKEGVAGVDQAERPAFVIPDGPVLGIDMEPWWFFSRAVRERHEFGAMLPRLEEAE